MHPSIALARENLIAVETGKINVTILPQAGRVGFKQVCYGIAEVSVSMALLPAAERA